MSIELLKKLRNVQHFTPWREWDNNLSTNCIAYALGLMVDDPKKEIFRTLLCGNPTGNLTSVFEQLGFQYRRINNPSELRNGEYGFVLYHYFYEGVVKMFGISYPTKCEETHLVRIELDGTWTHKFGWDYPTSTTSPEEIRDVILKEDHLDVSPIAYFAVRKPR